MSCAACDSKCENIIEKFPDKTAELDAYMGSLPIGDDREVNRGLLIQSLHKAQGVFGYLPEEVQRFVAEKLGLHLSEVYGVISFYSFFTTKPMGKYQISVCTGTACFVRGAGKVLDEFKRYLSVDEGETTEDGKFSLGALRCVGACSLAPVVMVNGRVYGNVTPKTVADILSECN
jgi:NADH:ubiquinone oxidoreductase subunit E